MADTEEVPENRLPRSNRVKRKSKYESIKKIIASDRFRIDPDLGFNGGGHSVLERYGLHPSHMDHLKSFGPPLEKHKEELIGLLSSKKNDEKLRTILINQNGRNSELHTCIGIIALSIGEMAEPILPPAEEAEEAEEAVLSLERFQVEPAAEDDDPEFTTEHPVLADTNAESESRRGIASGLKALIENLEEQMACITDLIHFLEVDGSTKNEMDQVITRLGVLLKNESKRNVRMGSVQSSTV